MLVKGEKGNNLLEIIPLDERQVDKLYSLVNHALGIVKMGEDYLLGWTK